MLDQVLILIGTGLGSSALTVLITELFRKRNTKAEASATEATAEVTLADSTLDWTKLLTSRIDSLEKRIDVLHEENVKLRETLVEVKTELRFYKEGRFNVTGTIGGPVDVKNS